MTMIMPYSVIEPAELLELGITAKGRHYRRTRDGAVLGPDYREIELPKPQEPAMPQSATPINQETADHLAGAIAELKGEVAPESEVPRETEIHGDYIVDVETGEVVGMVDMAPKFAVTDADSANWVLGKMLQAEAEVAAIDNSALVIHARAVLTNAERMKRDRLGRLNWLHLRFDAELGEYARNELKGKKSKTFKTLLGSISLVANAGGLAVVKKGEATALEIAKKLGFTNAVKTSEEFQISKLTAEQKAALTEAVRKGEVAPGGFEVKPPSEKVTVTTGVNS
ncbi:host-nuclease inhibitor Gam family protein [Fimbriimonas ginsengisoli]|uniref:Uncharacterized protein n=1 Tax=Fimbriimonas ginsengisoli Gsoil 348 TaxID=661478 RepID=A0A068NPK4_FIMGI|nr:host-nuclease inhibitor Gam family protein [Fimbriimonas ginsengisoli]AIE83509.1 hypothetical protein OP10G_0141 [Fimbriimonas ginsengisoli Gsoil 348]